MADKSPIEWTDATWNPVVGCSIVSPGCTNCYAMRMAARLDAMGMRKYRGLTRKSGGRAVWTGKVSLDRNSLMTPATWKKPRRSMTRCSAHSRSQPENVAYLRDLDGNKLCALYRMG